MNNNTWKFAEVTVMAMAMFIMPIGYYYGRPSILAFQDRMYYRVFGFD